MNSTNDPILEEDPKQLTMERVLPPQSDTLGTILTLGKRLLEVRQVQEELRKSMDKFEAEERELSETRIPDLMNAVGLTELRMSSGHVISSKVDYFASIPKAKRSEAFDWLRSKNMSGVIKEVITVDKERKEALIAATIPFEVKEDIHASTLKALVKEQIEAGNEFPRELFGVHVANKIVIKD